MKSLILLQQSNESIRCISFSDLAFKEILIKDTWKKSDGSCSGIPFTRWVKVGMPKIPQEILDCVFYLYKDEKAAETGKGFEGTGFLVGVPFENGMRYQNGEPFRHFYAVTNYHAIMEASVLRINTINGTTQIITTDNTEWTSDFQRYDIAVMPISLDQSQHKVKVVGTELFIKEDLSTKYEIGPGDDVFMIGKFVDHDGKEINMPAVRFGNISINPAPIKTPNNFPKYKLPSQMDSYCLDMHSRTGFSGSPVFMYRTVGSDLQFIDDIENGNIRLTSPSFFGFLGIHWGQFSEEWSIKDENPKIESYSDITNNICELQTDEVNSKNTLKKKGAYVEGVSGMTCVLPAWNILEVLNQDKLKIRRKEIEDQFKDCFFNEMSTIAESNFPLDRNPNHEVNE